jgi:hypothetical protein
LVYGGLALATALPVLRALFKKVELHPGGPSFDDSPHFSPEAKERLRQNFGRIKGSLNFWKNEAAKYKYIHYYAIAWTLPASVLIPVLTQTIGDDLYARWLLTIVSIHVSVLIAFDKGLHVGEHFQAYRQGESEFYDLYRRLLDRPHSFGKTEVDQLDQYFVQVEGVRKAVRTAETETFPSLAATQAPLPTLRRD